MGNNRIAELIMLEAHYQYHAAKDIILATSCHTACIVNGRKLATKICKGSVCCRCLRKPQQNHKMADLPDTLQCPAPPLTNVGLDLLGPITIKAMVNKRARMKVWVVIFIWLNTKAVSMELATGYSTNDFMLAYYLCKPERGTWICAF